MGGSCQPSGGIKTQIGRIGSSPKTSTPNSRVDIFNMLGQIVQQIWYGFTGQRIWSRDWSHGGGNHTFPHDNEWEDGKRIDITLNVNPDFC